jgi:NADP-dependent 3-hydroxy acid dehydrogenase YdfG
MIETNVLGLMRMTRLCLPHIRAGGAIVNLGSVAGIWSYPSGSGYVASKFAVHGYTRALRDDLQGRPIRVTNVAPGLVETNFSKVRFHGDDEKASAVYSNVALGGPLRAEDVADCILFAVTRPAHVNVDEIVVMALAQTSGGNILRE